IDVSTGFFNVEHCSIGNIATVLSRIDPAEIVMPDVLLEQKELKDVFNFWKKKISTLPLPRFDERNTKDILCSTFNVSTLDILGDLHPSEIKAAGACVDYIEITQKQRITHLERPKVIREASYLVIDSTTRRNLELIQTQKGEYQGSFLSCIDNTKTAGGGRLLGQRLSAPFINIDVIQKHLDQIDFFYKDFDLCKNICSLLSYCPDMERAVIRLNIGRGGPRDLGVIRQCLIQNSLILKDFKPQDYPFDDWYFDDFSSALNKLKCALVDDLPLLIRDGGFVREGYDQELGEKRKFKDNAKGMIKELQQKYIKETGIPSLKIKFNNMLGYHIDVTSTHVSKVPYTFILRQGLASSSRYSTVELSEYAKSIESASYETIEIEKRIFDELIDLIKENSIKLQKLCRTIDSLDVCTNLTKLAKKHKYTRPTLDKSNNISIKNGRHPVVEQYMDENHTFVANDCEMNDNKRLLLLTGPNMAGKSTYLRQNPLIIILAQMGSFVPVKRAHIGIVDRIFSRIGASDDLAAGRSTFMVEMVETATILHQSTARSFVILDEIGRGTATCDGLSIAWAIIHYLYHNKKCRVLFATHFHELTDLSKELKGITCLTPKVKEWGDNIVFLYEIIKGKADQSYGIHVAKLAGLPESVIKQAFSILKTLKVSKINPQMELALKEEVNI
ncbi:MAG: DNA mismatch repair protein MutS, partial [Alphaproteobacteria bacterium]